MERTVSAGRRRVSVSTPAGSCLSCDNGTVTLDGARLKVFCARRHRHASGCPDYSEDGRAGLLNAIVARIRKTQRTYRGVFRIIEPDCPNCRQNCCTQPFLNKTPFYGEDAIYYLLINQPLPSIPEGVDHCIFFDRGCTLPDHLRPHVCIEYKCPFIENPPQIDTLGEQMEEDVTYLIAVATQQFVEWRGVYPEQDETGATTGRMLDRHGAEWDPSDPMADLFGRYGVAQQDSVAQRPA